MKKRYAPQRMQTRWALFLLLLLPLVGCRTPTKTGNKVSLDPNHVTVINGKKVFPIGFSLGPQPSAKTPSGKNGLQELSDAGALFLRTGANGGAWNEHTLALEREWEFAAAKHGLYCWPNLRELSHLESGDMKRSQMLRHVVDIFKDSPGLGFWKGADEPQWGSVSPKSLEHARDIIRSQDTNHPIVIIQAPRGLVADLKPYTDSGDITGVDIYPISYPPGKNSLLTNKALSMVGDYTRKMMEVADNKMPVWMVLQIAWSGVIKNDTTLRFPTFAEERFMAYQAIINGARGLIFFGGNLTNAMNGRDLSLGWNWTFWERVLRPVVEEIGTHSPLEPALVAQESTIRPSVAPDTGLEWCIREVGEDIYLLACKREGDTVEATFSDLPIADGKYELMYEAPRSVQVTNGQFKDWFGPLEVHVYHFKRLK